METSEQQKWFVYLGDRHEGPFSLSEIRSKMELGQISSANYVWAEGMLDWQLMKEVSEFGGLIRPESTVQASPRYAVSSGSSVIMDVAAVAELKAVEHNFETVQQQPQTVVNLDKRPLEQFQTPPVSKSRKSKKSKKSKLTKAIRQAKQPTLIFLIGVGLVFLVVRGYSGRDFPRLKSIGGALSGYTEPLVQKLVVKYPILTKIISPVPNLDDVSSEELGELKSAAAASMADAGPSLTFAVSKADPLAPLVYVASNLPEGAMLDIYVEGIPDTLLNRTSVAVQTAAVVNRRFGKSATIRMNDGKPLPRGEYNIYVTDSQTQPDEVKTLLAGVPQLISPDAPKWLPSLKLLARKSYFLGGPKDQTYAGRLKEFHDKLREKANGELAEVKQFTHTLDSQLTETVNSFNRVTGTRNITVRKREWTAFHDRWYRLQSQLDVSFRKWTPDVLKNEFYYGRLYELIQQTGNMIRQLHTIQNEFLIGKTGQLRPDLNALQIQLSEAANVAQSTMVALKAKIDMAEKQPATANGMPNREGL